MDDDNELHPLDILSAYGHAGSFIEARLSRLKASTEPDTEDIDRCETMSAVLFSGILLATSYMDDSVRIVPDEDAPDGKRMLS